MSFINDRTRPTYELTTRKRGSRGGTRRDLYRPSLRYGRNCANVLYKFDETKPIPIVTSVSMIKNLPNKKQLQDASVNIPRSTNNLIQCVSAYDLPIIINTNAQSLVPKRNELELYIRSNHVELACITETWLKNNVPDACVSIDGFNLERRDRTDINGGGVCCYIQSGTPYFVWKELHNPDLETLWLTLRPQHMPRQFSHLSVGIIYHPPGCTARPRKDRPMLNHIQQCLDTILSKHPHSGVCVVGDFNKLKDAELKRYPLKQIVTTPTHGDSILDCMYTNMSDMFTIPIVDPGLGLSRHGIVLCKPTASQPKSSTITVHTRVNSSNAKALFANALQNVTWTPLLQMQTCQEQAACFQETITSLIDEYMPEKVVTKHISDKPWITQEYKDLISKRQKAFHKGHNQLYRYYRNQVNRMGKRLQANFYKNKIAALKQSDPRKWWKTTKSLLGVTNNNNASLQCLANDQFEGDMQKLADSINGFFHSVSAHLNPLDPAVIPDVADVPSEYIIEVEQVEKLLMATKVNKAPGPDGIPSWILRDLAGLISKPITAIFNSSIREGYVPSLWKSANITPIPKVNPPRSIQSDLRPISLTPVLAKHLEAVIGGWILDAIANKLDINQYGGLKGLSTTHALIDMMNFWHNAVHNAEKIRILFLDYSKAFDLVDHTILISKFRNLDVPDVLLRWMCAFLSDRQQRVKLGQDVSEWLTMKGAMPQGSWLGPLSFIVHISDLNLPLRVHKYMDDTTISEAISTSEDSVMQNTANSVLEWSNKNNMKINAKKTKEMIINFSNTPLNLAPLKIDDCELECVTEFKLLGVWLQSNLSWDKHVTSILSKVAQRLYFLKQLKRSGLSTEDLVTYYTTIIRPVLEYACQVWHPGLTKKHSKAIEHIQKRALHTICPGMDSNSVASKYDLDTLEHRRNTISKEFFLQLCMPDSKLNYLLPAEKATKYNTRNTHKFPLPRIRNNRYKKDFIVYSLFNFQ